MTPTQFQTFLQQLDASLKQISTEVSQEQMDLSTQLFIKAILMKLRVAFQTIGRHLLSQEARKGVSPREPVPQPDFIVWDIDNPTDLYYQNEEWLREVFV